MANLKNDLTNWFNTQNIELKFYPKSYQIQKLHDSNNPGFYSSSSLIGIEWQSFFEHYPISEYKSSSLVKFFDFVLFSYLNIKTNQENEIFDLFKNHPQTFVPLAVNYIKLCVITNAAKDPFQIFDFSILSDEIKHSFFELISQSSLMKNIDNQSKLFKIINKHYDNAQYYLDKLSIKPKEHIAFSTKTTNTFIFEVLTQDLFEYNLNKSYDRNTLLNFVINTLNDVKNFDKELDFEVFMTKHTTKNIKLFFVGNNLNTALIETVLKEKLKQLLSFNHQTDIENQFKPLSFEFIENIKLQLQIPETSQLRKAKNKI